MRRGHFTPALGLLLTFLSSAAAARAAARAAEPATQPASGPAPQGPGDSVRKVTVGGRERSYLVHVPPGYDAARPAPVVLAFHGAFMNGAMMETFCGLNRKADGANFVVAYPNGTGIGRGMLFFNAFTAPGAGAPDDVAFTAALLDDLATVVAVDPRRVFATGMSNGGMMCHRLAAELPDRIAAVAPVAGTAAMPDFHPRRPVPILMFHGTADTVVPWAGAKAGGRGNGVGNGNGAGNGNGRGMSFRSVDETLKIWLEADGCTGEPKVTDYPDAAKDGTTARRKVWGPGKEGAEVGLVEIEGGGHTWPGRQTAPAFLGKATANVSADDLIWEFFQKHPMK